MNHYPEDQYINYNVPEQVFILPVRNIVLFPGVCIPITAGRNKSIKLIKDAYNRDRKVGVLTQKDYNTDNPKKNDLYKIGTIAKIVNLFKMQDGTITVILQGRRRFKIKKIIKRNPYLKADIIPMEEFELSYLEEQEYFPLIESIKELTLRIIKLNKNLQEEANLAIISIDSTFLLINFIACNLNITIKDKQSILEINDFKIRVIETYRFLNIEYHYIILKNEMKYRVRIDIDQQQREYLLQQQMKEIQDELGDITYDKEIEKIRFKSYKKKWPKEVNDQFQNELIKLQRTPTHMQEYTIQINYLEFMLDLPWQIYSKDYFDLEKSKKILDRNHYGMEKVKDRIIEYLAVLKLRSDIRSPILCISGPPGVGKTSLGKSIATAIKRKYVIISLGGIHDESEIRGHRRTYIGAMPGRLLQSIKKAKTSNPVFLLDEIDKIGKGGHGIPAFAMLEVLDPEQNTHFYDNFLELGYDLSKVFFIATANSINEIPSALLDRMEIIEINGYTIEEKIKITKNYILPKLLTNHGLNQTDLVLGINQIENIIESYTLESGVRCLEQKIAKLTRYITKKIAMNKHSYKKLTIKEIEKVIGVTNAQYIYENNNVPGVVTGLAWTSVGGDIIYIESVLCNGKGLMSITGNIGNVMKESATIALQYVKCHYLYFNIDKKKFEEKNIHIHVPEGSIPKDGPSAGITILTSLVSIYSNKLVRPNIAMTGEITLRGIVLPVGKIQEKILAAKRFNIKEIILSKYNEKDVLDIKKEYIHNIIFHYVKNMKEVINIALQK
jgi:ATP-dependent Lon protease